MKNIPFSLIKEFFSRFKNVTRLPGFKRYIFLAFALTLIFTIFMFPYEILVMNQLKKLEGRNFKSLDVKQLSINILNPSYADNISVVLLNGASVSIDKLTADISFLSLIRKNFTGNIMADQITYSSDQGKLECSANSNLELKMDDQSGTIPSNGKIKAIINNIRLSAGPELLSGLPLPQSIKISSVNIDSNITNRSLVIKDFTVSGKDLRGKISGDILLAPIFGNSKLNLKISVEPDSALLTEFQPLLKQFTDSTGKIVLSLSGTVSRAKTNLGKTNGNEKTEIPPFVTNPEE